MANANDIKNPYGETYSEKQRRQAYKKTLNNERADQGKAPVEVGPEANTTPDTTPSEDFPTPTRVTDADVRRAETRAEAKQAATAPDFTESWGLAREEINVAPYVEKQLTGDELPDDPEYQVSPDEFDKATKGIPTEYLGELEDVQSHEQLVHQSGEIRESLERRRQLSSAGFTGLAATLGASIFNEENAVITAGSLVTGSAVGDVGLGLKATRFARLARSTLAGSAAGAGENAAIQAYIAHQSETQGTDSVLSAAALGGALGGAAGGMFGTLGRDLRPVEGEAAARYHVDDDAFESISADLKKAIDRKDYADAQAMVDRHVSDDGKPYFADRVEDMKSNSRRVQALDEDIATTQRKLEQTRAERPVDDLVNRAPRRKESLEDLGGVSRLSRALGKTPDQVSPDTERVYHALMPESKAKELTRTKARQMRKQYDQRVRIAQRDQQQRVVKLESDLEKHKADKAEANANLDQQRADFGEDLATFAKVNPKPTKSRTVRQPKPEPDESSNARADSTSANAAENEGAAVPEQVHQEAVVPDDWGSEGYKPFASSVKTRGGRRIRFRFDPFATMVDQDLSPTMRGYAQSILPDPVGTSARSGETTKVAASEFAASYFSGRTMRWVNRNRAASRAWSQANGKPLRWETNVQEFQKLVHRQVERGDVGDPNVAEAAKAWADMAEYFHHEFRRLGRTGFKDFDANENYVPRNWLPDRFVAANANPAVGMRTVRKAMRAAIRKEQPDISDELADTLTEAIIKRKHAEGYGIDPDFNRGIFSRDEDEMRMALRAADMDDDDIQSLIESLKKADGEKAKDGRSGSAQRRIKMDVYEEVSDLDGNPFAVSMLMETDMQRVAERYSRQSAGILGYLKAMRNEGIEGEIEPSNYHQKVVRQVRAEMPDKSTADDYAGRLDRAYKVLMGIPIEDNTAALKTAGRFANGFAYAAYAGQFGIAQVPELSNMVAELGFRNTLASVTRLRSISRRAYNGELEDEAAQEMMDIGVGLNDRLMNQPRSQQDTDFQVERDGWVSGETMETGDRWLQKTNRTVGDLSGMNGINLMFNKMMAVVIGRRFHELAGKAKLSASDRSRLRNVGLTDAQQDQVLKYIKKHGGRTKDGTLTLGMKHWVKETAEDGEMDPADLRDLFHGSVFKMSSNIIQRNNPNDLPPKMADTVVGRLILQFRSFVMNAWAKQTLRHVGQADRVMVSAGLISTFLGAMSYMGRTYVNSLGEKDPEQYRRDRLTEKAIAYAGATRTGMSSIIPMIVSPTMYEAGMIDKPLGSYSRTSGLGQNPVSGSPALQMLGSGANAVSAGSQMAQTAIGLDDHRFSRRDFEAFKALVPFQNAWGVRNILAHMGKGLPSDNVNSIRTGSDYVPFLGGE